MRTRRRPLQAQALFAISALCAALGCAEMKDLVALQGGLADEYGEVAVHIDASGGQRVLELTLSPDASDDRDRAELAIEIARTASAAYPHSVDRWIVVFGGEKDAGPLHFEWSSGRYEFASNEL